MIQRRFAEGTDYLLSSVHQGVIVSKRDGRKVPFEPIWIQRALDKAFRAELGVPAASAMDTSVEALIRQITKAVVADILRGVHRGFELEIEVIQDSVENNLMKAGMYSVARRYILYREDRRREREEA